MDPHQVLLASVAHLSNAELLARVQHLVTRERHTTAVLIAHLAELDERRLYLAEGYPSLFAYCTQGLRLSEHAAYNRIEAARAARRFPVILERLADGSVTLTAIRLLAPHLTSDNHLDLLEKARHQSKRDVEELVAQLHPQPSVPGTIRRLPARRHLPTARTAVEAAQAGVENGVEASEGLAAGEVPTSESQSLTSGAGGRTPATIAPLSPQNYRIQFTASAETHEKLRQAQALLRHQIPDGNVATIIDRALTALLEQVAKQKVAATDRPRQISRSGAALMSRHIPNAVKREVWVRDGGRCAFVSQGGRCCSEDGFLEFHHLTPYAAGGEATAENIELRCRAHNAYEARLYFGSRALPELNETGAAVPSEPSQVRDAHAVYSGQLESSHIGKGRKANSSWNEFGQPHSGPSHSSAADAKDVSGRRKPSVTHLRLLTARNRLYLP